MPTSSILPPDKRGYADSSVFITTEWIAERLGDPHIRVVDTNYPHEYAEGHIPGAVGVVDNYYKTSMEDRTHIQGPEQFAGTMSSLGIGDDTLVIASDSHGGIYSFRLMWALHYYGHKAVKFLDGGLPKWAAEGRPVTRNVPDVAPAKFTSKADKSIFASKEDILAAINDKDTVVLDVRSDEERDGSNKRGGKRGGYVPNSVHLEWVNFHTGGDVPMIKTAGELRAMLAKVGVTPDKKVITYCQGGIRAAHGFWSLKLAGFKDVRDYDASWRQWGNDLTCPITVGEKA
jgi:thiosulfate/3-mercaptopyruvate sulfurtransferase